MHELPGARCDELRDLLGDPLGHEIGWVLLIEQIERKGPFARMLVGSRRDERPEFKERWQLMLQGLVRPPNVSRCDNSALVLTMLEHFVDRCKHTRRGAEGRVERDTLRKLWPPSVNRLPNVRRISSNIRGAAP